MTELNSEEKYIKNSILVTAPSGNTPFEQQVCKFLADRVHNFILEVVRPFKEQNESFPKDKIKWFFQIYCEGLEARKLQLNAFENYVEISKETIDNLVFVVNNRSAEDIMNLGLSFIVNTANTLIGFHRDSSVRVRYQDIYSKGEPVDWINYVVDNHTLLQTSRYEYPELKQALEKLQLLMRCLS